MLNQVFFRAEVDQHHTVASHHFWVIWKTLKRRLVIDLRARTLHDLLFSATHHLFSHFLFHVSCSDLSSDLYCQQGRAVVSYLVISSSWRCFVPVL